jgi:hypothetical protein
VLLDRKQNIAAKKVGVDNILQRSAIMACKQSNSSNRQATAHPKEVSQVIVPVSVTP